ncbi:class I SAM-dependent methyltransferase [Zavarzinella formosa]|uniref:hypothetical protein n=1 Tax=Zavarzinella formosa TaxID=360055 RepID=UPI000303478A|nr:hypothetical protein [Zavarzinella formosa]
MKLLGTFNGHDGIAGFKLALAEASRVLRPGGRVFARGMVGDRPYPGRPDFPGLTAKIRFIPTQTEPLDALAQAGFRGVEVETWKEVGCLQDASGVGFRSVTISAWKVTGDSQPRQAVRYDGPFAKLTDDDGTAFHRGIAVAVTTDQAERLRNSPASGQFIFVDSPNGPETTK